MPPAGAKRSWVRLQFYDYPVLDGNQWYGAPSSGKTKVYCSKCFVVSFDELKTREQSEVALNIRQHARSDEELRHYSTLFVSNRGTQSY
jgi:hypothetical protein